jgi:uncharacterized DUF497 family protein
VEFEWDENKRRANLRKHGVDLLAGTVVFDGRPVYVYPSPRFDEQRFVAIGLLNDEFVALVWTERSPATRLISLRRARNAEKRAYRALFS